MNSAHKHTFNHWFPTSVRRTPSALSWSQAPPRWIDRLHLSVEASPVSEICGFCLHRRCKKYFLFILSERRSYHWRYGWPNQRKIKNGRCEGEWAKTVRSGRFAWSWRFAGRVGFGSFGSFYKITWATYNFSTYPLATAVVTPGVQLPLVWNHCIRWLDLAVFNLSDQPLLNSSMCVLRTSWFFEGWG